LTNASLDFHQLAARVEISGGQMQLQGACEGEDSGVVLNSPLVKLFSSPQQAHPSVAQIGAILSPRLGSSQPLSPAEAELARRLPDAGSDQRQ
jgi:hypothetical protein